MFSSGQGLMSGLPRLVASFRFQQLLGVAVLAGLVWVANLAPPAAPAGSAASREQMLRKKMARKLEKQRKGLKPFQYPNEAEQYFVRKRALPRQNGLPMERYQRALEYMRTMPRYSIRTGELLPPLSEEAPSRFLRFQTGSGSGGGFKEAALGSWTFRGPGNIGGRTRGLLIHPTTTTTMWAAGVAGGVWKTTDGGASWSPKSDLIAHLAVNSMTLDPGNANVIYAGTGEGYFNFDAVRGNGIFKSTDGGDNWTHLTNTSNTVTTDFRFVNDIVVSPFNSSRVYAATNRGIMRSTDGGTNWTTLFQPVSKVNMAFIVQGGCLDLAIRTDTSPNDHLFAACGTFEQSFVVRSTDAGAVSPTFTEVLTETFMGRTSLAIAPSSQTTIYALSASIDSSGNFDGGLHKVFRSTNAGDMVMTWSTQVDNTNATKLNTLLLSNPVFAFGMTCGLGSDQFFNQGWYDNVIAVDPADANRVWVGGIDLFRSDDAGANWGLASYWWASDPGQVSDPASYAHADHHVIRFHPGYDGSSNKVMFVGNDGGLFRTNDARASTATNACMTPPPVNVAWTEINNNYGVTQFYHGLPYPGGLTFFGGTQDNGTLRGTTASTNWQEAILGGDGGYVGVEPTDTNILYAETPNGALEKSTNGGTNFSAATSGLSDTGFAFITPFVLDPSAGQNSSTRKLWIGGSFIWRSDDAAGNWTQASTQIDDDPSFGGANAISAIAVAATDSNRVLVGTAHGIVYRNTSATTADSTTVWSQSQPRDGFISWVAFDPNDGTHQTVYATVSSFNFGPPHNGHVFKSTNGGANWTDITNDLPDIPVHSIIVDPGSASKLYIATDLGVFSSVNGGTNWLVENTGFANVITEALAVTNISSTPNLFAFTHGRGTWHVALPASDNPVPTVTNAVSPTALPTNVSSFKLTVFGTNFVSNSVVRWNGGDRTTTFVSSTQLQATIPGNFVETPGSATITVFNPAPGGGTSNGVTFNFNPTPNFNPPIANSITPGSAVVGQRGLVLTVTGADFAPDAVVRWNGASRPTRAPGAGQLQVLIPARDLARSGTVQVTVLNPGPNGGESNALTFTVEARAGSRPRGRRQASGFTRGGSQR